MEHTKIKTEIIEQIKEIKVIHSTEFTTVDLAATYYEVGLETIKTLIKRNKEELESDGLRLLSGREIRDYFDANNIPYQNCKGYFVSNGCCFANRNNTLISMKALLRIGMYLTESDIAVKVRKKTLDVSPQLYYELVPENSIRLKKYEKEIGNFLEFAFGAENIKKQVRCGKYYIDFVLYDCYAIEVDEYGHRQYDKSLECEREEYISKNSNYYIIRYNPHTEKPYKLLSKIYEINEMNKLYADTFSLDWCLIPSV